MQKKYGQDGPQLISVYQSLGRVSLNIAVSEAQFEIGHRSQVSNFV